MTEELQETDRAALRAFLQRAETRLSTMHGVAGAFISGAGLLTLLPVFYRDSSGAFIALLKDDLVSRALVGDKIFTYSYLVDCWTIPFVFSLAIPLYALYLLIRQLVRIYLVPHGDDQKHIFPRFSLSALSFPVDEGEESGTSVFSKTKLKVIKSWYKVENVILLLPPGVESAERKSLRKIYDEMKSVHPTLYEREREKARHAETPSDHELELYDFRAATSGLTDRLLIDEAARVEASLSRLSYHLRVTVIRYVKSLLIFIWTAILLSVCVSYLSSFGPLPHSIQQLHQMEVGVLIAGIVWATATPIIASFPIHWLRTTGSGNANTSVFREDSDLTGFEENVYSWCRSGVCAAYLALVFSELFEELPIHVGPVEASLTLFGGAVCLAVVFSYQTINRKLNWK